ncbi:protein of unknown function [Pararobbsia alpina]
MARSISPPTRISRRRCRTIRPMLRVQPGKDRVPTRRLNPRRRQRSKRAASAGKEPSSARRRFQAAGLGTETAEAFESQAADAPPVGMTPLVRGPTGQTLPNRIAPCFKPCPTDRGRRRL